MFFFSGVNKENNRIKSEPMAAPEKKKLASELLNVACVDKVLTTKNTTEVTI